MAVALAVPGWGMGEPRDVMVFFATDDALELGGILGLVEPTEISGRFHIFQVSKDQNYFV